MRKVLAILLTFFFLVPNANAQLAAGDIAFTGYNSDANGGGLQNDFSFVILRSGGIPANTPLIFTDNGYKVAGGVGLLTTEGTFTWTSPNATMAQFTHVYIKINAAGAASETISAKLGATTVAAGSISSITNAFILSQSGDQILAYQTSPTLTFISGIHMNSDASGNISSTAGWDNMAIGTTFSQNRSDVPPGLTGGINCVAPDPSIGTSGSEKDNGIYNCTGASAATLGDIRQAINTAANWTLEETTLLSLVPNCTFGISGPAAPTVTTNASPSSITATSAVLGGEVTVQGSSSVTDRGIVWATTANPSINNNKASNGNGTGSFTGTVSSLPVSTLIYYKAFGTNAAGTGYGTEHTFTTATPTISITGSFSAFTTCAGTVSTAQSVSVSGSNLVANITVSVPTGFEVSTALGSGYASSVSLAPSSGTISSVPVYVRLASTASGSPSGNLACASTSATTQNKAVTGTANPLPSATIGSISNVFTNSTSFSLPYTNATGSPDQYSIATSTPTAMPSFSAVSNAALSASPINVTIPASAANTYNFNLALRNSSTGCVSAALPFTLTVATQPSVTATGTVNAFSSCNGSVSAAQSFNASGANLTGNIVVTPPTGFEVSTSLGSGYGSTVTLVPSSGIVNATAVFVRLASSATGTPSGNVTVTSTGATLKNVAVSGTVNALPVISNPSTATTCSGSGPAITLAANMSSTYTWTLGTNTGSISGASASTGSPTTINQTLTNPSTTVAGSIVYIVVPTSVTGSCVGSASNITVTVNPLTAVNVDPSATSACAGGNTSFTVGATGNNLSYQWQVNQGSGYADIAASAPYSNVTQSTMNITGAVVGMNGYSYRCVVSGNCPSATSNGASLTVAHVWLGASATWTTGSNWSCGSAPIASSNVIIPSGTTFSPTITSNVTLNQLTINSGALLSNTGTNRTFTLNGTLVNNGTLSVGTNNLVLNSTVSGTGTISSTATSTVTVGNNVGTLRFTPGTNNLYNLILNDNTFATLGNALNIVGGSSAGAVSIGVSATLNTGGFLTLKSNATGTAYIEAVQSGGAINGNVTVERFIPAKAARKWSFVTAPVTGPTLRNAWQQQVFVTGAGTGGAAPCAGTTTGNGGGTDRYNNNGFDISVNNAATVYSYNGALANGSRWVAIPNTATALVAGKGYRANIRGERGASDANCIAQINTANAGGPSAATLAATGTLRVGDVTVTLDGVSGNHTLLGNPYASSIDFDLFNTDNTSLAGKYWFYSPDNAASPTTIYSAYTTGSMTNKPTGYTDANSNIIASGQSFFVEKAAAATVTFKEAHKVAAQSGSFRTISYDWSNAIRAGLKNADGSIHLDEVLVRFGNVTGASKNYTDTWDARSINEGGPVIVSLKGTDRLAIQTRPLNFNDDTVKLGVAINIIGNYQLVLSEYEAFTTALVIKLRDRFLGTEQDIKTNAVYPFSVTADANSKGDNRFEIVFRSNGALPVSYIGITAKNKGANDVEVNWQLPSETDVKKYEVERSANGSSFELRGTVNSRGNSLTQQSYSYTDAPRLSGTSFYRVKATDKSGAINYSPVVKVSNGKEQLTVAIYPNPVKDKLNMVIQNIDGAYTIKISTMEGKTMIVQNGNTATGNIVTINTAALAAGIYMVETMDSKGNRSIEKMVKE